MSSSIHELAGQAYGAFTTTQRGDDTIVVLKDDRPQWVYDLVQAAHGEFFLPDDWRYASIRNALSAIHDDAPDDLDDYAGEWADGNVDTYTMARLQWLASNLQRTFYCDDAAGAFDPSEDGIVGLIGMGQYMESSEIYASVVQSLRDHADELES